MATVEIRDKFDGRIIESHQIDTDIASWLQSSVPSYREMDRPPFTAELNSHPFPASTFSRPLKADDVVTLVISPRDPVTAIFTAIAVLSAAYAYNEISNLPNFQDSSAASGNSIYSPSARGNKANPNGIIKEIAGSMTDYPDIIGQFRRYNDHKEELYLMLCLGRGYFAISEENGYVSESRIVDQPGTEMNFYEPGQDLSADIATANWYTSKEVDNIELDTATGPINGIWTMDIDGDQITAYLNGDGFAPFPFAVGEFFEITNSPGGSYNGYYYVSAVGGLYLNIATVENAERANGDTGRLEIEANSILSIGHANPIARDANRRLANSVGSPSFPSLTGLTVSWSGLNGGEKYFGIYNATPPGVRARYYEADILFPRGLSDVDGDGTEASATVDLLVQYRDFTGAAGWADLDVSFTAATYDARAYTVEIDAGEEIEGRFRFRRKTSDSQDINIADRISVTRLKARLNSPSSYGDETVVTIKFDGRSSLSRAAENQINFRGHTRKLPTIAELEANSWDLSNSATLTSGDWGLSGGRTVSRLGITDELIPKTASNVFIGFDLSPDGNNAIVSDDSFVRTLEIENSGRFDLGYEYDDYRAWKSLSGGVLLGSDSVSVAWCRDGLSFYMLTDETTILSFNLVAAYNLGTASFVSSYFTAGDLSSNSMASISVRPDGGRFWINNREDSVIVEYNVLTPGHIASSSLSGVTFDAATLIGDTDIDDGTNLKAIDLTDFDGGEPSRVYLMRQDGKIFRADLLTAGDITTITSTGDTLDSYLASGVEPQNIRVRADYVYVSYMSDGVGFIQTVKTSDITDSRASRSPIRFAGLMLREALGQHADHKVDWDKMEALETEAANRGDTLDADFSEETTLGDAVKLMLAPALIEPSIKEGSFHPVKIKADLSATHMYTPDVMTGDGLQISSAFFDPLEPDGIEVEYFNLETNTNEIVDCLLAEDDGLRKKRIQLIGATTARQAWVAGMRERRRQKLKPLTYSFDTEMDALNSDYGDIVLVSSEVFANQFASVTEYSGSTVTLDTDVDLTGGTIYAAIRKPDGSMTGLYEVDSDGVDSDQLNLVSPSSLDFTPITDGSADPSFVAIGTIEQLAKYAIIREINPGGDGSVSVTAEEYLEDIYADDDNEPA